MRTSPKIEALQRDDPARFRPRCRADIGALVAGLQLVDPVVPGPPTGRVPIDPSRSQLPCGDYGLILGGRLVAAAERKSMPDLVASLTGGKLLYALADLAALPRAAVVVEDRYSRIFDLERVRPALVADGLAEPQVRWPNVPIVYAETRPLAEEWTYRYLAAAHAWAAAEDAAATRIGPLASELDRAPDAPGPSTAEVRAWAREHGITVPDRGRLRPRDLRRLARWPAAATR